MIGIFTFLLMLRGSMLVGWWVLLSRTRSTKQRGSGDFIINGFDDPKHMSLGRPLASEKALGGIQPGAVLPDPAESIRKSSVVPQAGDVTKRHETTNLFEDVDDEDDEGRTNRVREESVV